ncbi:threonylcarbamoyl-AMP synthase [Desulfohalobiaceae bacterium Ax17]|uniref:L-threonylcarbamoyladenylate synthase n=1 Tax=Desulfovulcanus ferrireducens TaxID=2831190 RepID=UPI00207BB59E|nr:L-threonylcarbamoyladenylate synthase [Desulfovulcanus ferrireducens]MBT8762489.1 threonylcarbamoyl-AMP synthase [Desulfovulcanus ferrireducens]
MNLIKDAINTAIDIIRQGGIIVYPTETFLGLGGNGLELSVVQRIQALKKRPAHKPLPLIIGGLGQLEEICYLTPFSLELARDFWPGPLSILFRAKEIIPFGVKDAAGMVSVRLTPHPVARQLCTFSGYPLIATSANLSGKPPCTLCSDLDPEVLEKVDFVLDVPPEPTGELPSTLVRMLGGKEIEILRHGVISEGELSQKGYKVVRKA